MELKWMLFFFKVCIDIPFSSPDSPRPSISLDSCLFPVVTSPLPVSWEMAIFVISVVTVSWL